MEFFIKFVEEMHQKSESLFLSKDCLIKGKIPLGKALKYDLSRDLYTQSIVNLPILKFRTFEHAEKF